ncbi:MAG: phosphotransferase [Pseudomonadales bacterium]|nr:phosphotransferase [Pseudomonadales bacterium]
MSVIPTADSIDADFLTRVLRSEGFPDVTVDITGVTQIGTGQIGKCVRYTLDVHQDPHAPQTLVGKFPSDDPLSRATGVQLRNYIKEVAFYRELKPRLSIPTPRCFYADIQGEGPEFALLLEDLAPAQQGDQLKGCSPAVARAAVLGLVGLHAPSWCDASLRGIDWLGEPDEAGREMLLALYRAQLPGFLERYGARLSADEAALIAAVGDSPNVLGRPLCEPFSLVHIDYRLDNLLIDASTEPATVYTVDWQSVTLGNPMTDVAYFLGAGLLPEVRQPVEQRLVHDYHAALAAAGVSDYGWDDCWRDYRRAAFAGFPVTVVASMLVQRTARGDEMFTAMARRHARHALDLQADEFL